MNDTQKSELMMLIRVDQFGKDHPLLPAIAKATLHYGTVASAKDQILAMSGLKVLGTGEFRAAAADRQFVVADLRVKLREIAVTAKALDRLGESPGLGLQFRLPKWTMQDLRDRAVAFKDAVEPIKQMFIDYGSAATVVEDLEAAIADFDEVTGRRYTGLGKQVGATAGVAARLRQGVTAVRALDAILIKQYRDNPSLLAEWKAAQRIAGWPSVPAAPEPEPAPVGGENPPPPGS